MADPILITSPLSGPFTEGDMTVDVQIYRLEDTPWTLEVVDGEGTSTCLCPLIRSRPRKRWELKKLLPSTLRASPAG